MRTLIPILIACLVPLASHGQALHQQRQPKPLIPRQIIKSPKTYLDRTVRVGGSPTVKQEPGTGIWKGTCDGAKVELTKEAKAYLDKVKPTGIRPVFHATLRKRGGEYILVYQKGLPVQRP